MNISAILAFLFVTIIKVNAQFDSYPARALPTNVVEPPIKPIDKKTSNIFYPSEDTNMNRRPSHVSTEVRGSLRIKQKFSYLRQYSARH